MNFGTGSVEDALAYVEYCNYPRGTRWSELRRAHGSPPRPERFERVGLDLRALLGEGA